MTGFAPPQRPILEASEITRHFPGVRALHRVRLTLFSGEVVGLVGENGAGKSTLMKILAGVIEPDSGCLRIDGIPQRLGSVRQAVEHGIALIHQELQLADNLDIASNIFLGREPHVLGLIDRRSLEHLAAEHLRAVGLRVSPAALVERLPIGQRQLVEIAKALAVRARVLIMDEPTSSLSATESQTLFGVVRRLRAQGVSVVYISHRLGEIEELADRVVVLRDGENAGELSRDEIDRDALVRRMVGRDIARFYARRPHVPGAVALDVDLATPAFPQHRLRFQVRGGEIVGLAGLVGAGRSALLKTLFGIEQARGGTIRAAGRTLRFRGPRDAIAAGLALVPEDRQQAGLILDMSVRHNLTLAGLRAMQGPLGLLDRRAEAEQAERVAARLRIKTPHGDQPVRLLSGGNQQKVVLGKWLSLAPRVLLMDEPTRGIDVGAKEDIYRLMEALAARGVALLFASSELEEILGVSDRVLVMHEGRLAGQLSRAELSEEAVMRLATGAAADAEVRT